MRFSPVQPRRIFPVALLGPVLLALAACDDDDTAGQQQTQDPTVTVAEVAEREISQSVRFVGQMRPVDSIKLTPRVSGFLAEKLVEDGTFVSAGATLFRVEDDEYLADLAAAKADAAQTQANLALAEIELERSEKLLSSDTIAQSAYDAALATRDATAAQLEAANARIRLAELDLGYTAITAPFDGQIGRITASVGDTVGPQNGPLTELVRQSPIYATFAMPEGALLTFLQSYEGDIQADIAAEKSPPVRLELSNGTEYGETGQLVFVDNQVDPATGTIAFRALFENADLLLSPGVYVNVRVEAQEPVSRMVIPQSSVQRDQRGTFVLVVNDAREVVQTYVVLGQEQGTDVVVNSGVEEGASVIVEGLQKVRPGVKVETVSLPDSQEG